MRKESEKKSVTKSIKMTPEQESMIAEKAKDKGMSFSNYVVENITHNDNTLTPEMFSRVQEIVNCAARIVKKSGNMIEIENMKRELNKLWNY